MISSRRLTIFCLLASAVAIQADPNNNKNEKEVVALEEAQKNSVQQQQPQWAPNWYNGDSRIAAVPTASFGYQGYPYYAAPAGNAFMQPRGMPQPNYQPQPQATYQMQPQANYEMQPQFTYQPQPQNGYMSAQPYQQPYQTLPMQVYQQPQAYAQAYPQSLPLTNQQNWQTLPEAIGGNGGVYETSPGVQEIQPEGVAEVGNFRGFSNPTQPQATSWVPPQPQPQLWSEGANGIVPNWRRSFTPLPGNSGCYNRCRPSCSNSYGGCQPSCRSACNIRPSCPRRSDVQFAGSTMVCARPGYNFQNGQSAYFNQPSVGGWFNAAAWDTPTSQLYQGADNGLVATPAKLSYQANEDDFKVTEVENKA